MIKNVFYFMLKALFILEIFTFLSLLFGFVEKRLDKNVKVILVLTIGRPPLGHTIKTNFITLKTVDVKTCSLSLLCKRVWVYLFHHILNMIFQEKYFSCYILLTYRASLSGCLYFLRYWTVHVL